MVSPTELRPQGVQDAVNSLLIFHKERPGCDNPQTPSTGWGAGSLSPGFNLEWVLEYLEQMLILRLLKFKASFFPLRKGPVISVRLSVVALSPQKFQNH